MLIRRVSTLVSHRAKEETQTKSLLVKNVKAANAENATEENPDYHVRFSPSSSSRTAHLTWHSKHNKQRVWLLSLDWALESIKKDKKLKERDYDYERQADNVRAKRAAEALAGTFLVLSHHSFSPFYNFLSSRETPIDAR